MAKNKHHIINYTIQLDTRTTNEFQIELFEQVLSAVMQTSQRLKTTVSLIERKVIK